MLNKKKKLFSYIWKLYAAPMFCFCNYNKDCYKYIWFDYFWTSRLLQGPSWSWSYGSWIYNYRCNQCLSPLMLWVWTLFMARCTQYTITWSSLSVTFDRSVVFSTNKTDHHDITELLLKVVLNTINQTIKIVVECLVDSISVMTRTRSTNNTSAYMIRWQDWDWPMFWSFNWQK